MARRRLSCYDDYYDYEEVPDSFSGEESELESSLSFAAESKNEAKLDLSGDSAADSSFASIADVAVVEDFPDRDALDVLPGSVDCLDLRGVFEVSELFTE
ncbi:unnamed protein product [Soboliphyme baturini]|uniref:Uncharacterized protein n=1 Tax=Soboliphyme baturini TaxID=241478 RepID=A0A183IFT3_9BILA|nr:unnamed protein product [Soboliphyme baturini]